jgi:radical SAM protein with 4Fe4S-binding SPASM domain
VRHYLENKLDIFSLNPAVEKVPFQMKFTDYPVLSELAVTYKCNLRCQFCYAGCNCTTSPTGSDEVLSIDEFKAIIDKIYLEAQVPSISFTGGEPSLYKGLPQLVAHAKSHGMRVNLITNGTMVTEKLARELVDSGLDSVQVSLEGVSPAVHNELVQIKGAYGRTRRAIEYFKALGIHVHTNTTITQLNLNECRLMPSFVKKELGLDKFSMNLLIPTGSGIIYDHLVVGYAEIGSHLQQIIEESQKAGVEFMWYSPVPMCMFNTITNGLGNKGCSACDGLLSVAPNGDVLPCASFDDPVGNLSKAEFRGIWQSTKARMYRDKELAHDRCKSCEQFHICNGACPLYWRHQGYAELENLKPPVS